MTIDNKTNFDKVIQIARDFLQIQDLDMLLECILTEARSLVYADAGSIYLIEGLMLKFSYTQNNTLQKQLPFGKKLVYSTFEVQINNKSIVGYAANTGMIVNTIDAYRIDKSQPYTFDSHFDDATGYHTQSVLTVPIKNSLGKAIGVIQLINSLGVNKSIHAFTSTEESIVQLFADSAAVAIEHAKMIRSMITRMNRMIEIHDPTETIQHNRRIAAYTVEVYELWARKNGISDKEIEHNCDVLRMAAMLHDIGKVTVSQLILDKRRNHPNDLTPDETKDFQKHTIYGARLFPDIYSNFEEMAQSIALNHHENWDGSGYPGHVNIESGLPLPGYVKADGTAFGKTKEEISVYARIVAVANAYDILHCKHGEEEAVNKILANSGKKFDPNIVAIFISCLETIKSISARYPD